MSPKNNQKNNQKKKSFVVDTNVLVVANGKHKNAGDEDIFECGNFLFDLRQEKKMISIDSLGLILKEYFKRSSRSGQPGLGDAFAKWLFDNQFNASRCEQVEITPIDEYADDRREFLEFPADESLTDFDRDDQKFVAVAISSRFNAIICNATDSDWWQHKDHLKKHGVEIRFLCPDLIKGKNT